MPVIIFVYCYVRIFYIIRHHSKVSTGHAGQDVAMATMPHDQNAEETPPQTTEAGSGAELSRMELNVLQTMVTIIVCFVICWSPVSFANIAQTLTV